MMPLAAVEVNCPGFALGLDTVFGPLERQDQMLSATMVIAPQGHSATQMPQPLQ